MKKLILVLGAIALPYFSASLILPPFLEAQRNSFKSTLHYSLSAEAPVIMDRLDIISDLLGDSLLWGRNLTKRESRGQVDFPRMREANIALEMFTMVSKSPADENVKRFFLQNLN